LHIDREIGVRREQKKTQKRALATYIVPRRRLQHAVDLCLAEEGAELLLHERRLRRVDERADAKVGQLLVEDKLLVKLHQLVRRVHAAEAENGADAARVVRHPLRHVVHTVADDDPKVVFSRVLLHLRHRVLFLFLFSFLWAGAESSELCVRVGCANGLEHVTRRLHCFEKTCIALRTGVCAFFDSGFFPLTARPDPSAGAVDVVVVVVVCSFWVFIAAAVWLPHTTTAPTMHEMNATTSETYWTVCFGRLHSYKRFGCECCEERHRWRHAGCCDEFVREWLIIFK
jgi:hypothetical protein